MGFTKSFSKKQNFTQFSRESRAFNTRFAIILYLITKLLTSDQFPDQTFIFPALIRSLVIKHSSFYKVEHMSN